MFQHAVYLSITKDVKLSHWTQEVEELERSKPQCRVNSRSTDCLFDIDSSVYTSAWDKLRHKLLVIVYTDLHDL